MIETRRQTAGEFEHSVRELIEKLAVVRDEDHCALVFFQRFEEYILARQVQVVRRLVEHEQIRGLEQKLQQGEARSLSS